MIMTDNDSTSNDFQDKVQTKRTSNLFLRNYDPVLTRIDLCPSRFSFHWRREIETSMTARKDLHRYFRRDLVATLT